MKTIEEIEQIKRAPAETGVETLILKRWSPRAFADRALDPDDLRKLFEAARWAASSYNEQPWRFLVGIKGDEAYEKIFASLISFNQGWAKSAPVLVLSAAKKTFTGNGSANAYGLHDTGAATANLMLQAIALGIHTHSMAGFDADAVRAAFAIPDDFEVGAVTAIGYLGDSATLPDQQRQMEESARSRKPLTEFVFKAWDQSAGI